jgi:hypothetical protein
MNCAKCEYKHNFISIKYENMNMKGTKQGYNVRSYPKLMLNKGSKQHIMNQCVYFAFRTIVLFGIFFPKKHVFFKRNFQMKCFEKNYILYL